jgi:hypothetical protein
MARLVLLLTLLSLAAATIVPCEVTLDEIHAATLTAYTSRSECERSYFTNSACDDYWAQAGVVLQLETNYRDCRKMLVDEFLEFLVGSNWTNGEIARQARITREVTEWNHQQTQNLFTAESTATRNTVETQAADTQSFLKSVTETQNDLTRANLSAEAQVTRALVSLEAENTRILVNTEATDTQALINAQETQTRELVAQEAAATRTNVTAEHVQTRALINQESEQTRNTLTDVIEADGASSRANISAEAANTRTAIQNDGADTRFTISSDGTTTRQTITDQSTNIQNTVTTQAGQTNTLIQNNANTLSNSISSLQTSQNSFSTLFIQIMIEGSFAASPSSGRIDLFQRPAASGGYFETMKSIVLDVWNYNKAHYSFSNSATNTINGYLNSAASNEASSNYRVAWEKYRLAYLAAVSP